LQGVKKEMTAPYWGRSFSAAGNIFNFPAGANEKATAMSTVVALLQMIMIQMIAAQPDQKNPTTGPRQEEGYYGDRSPTARLHMYIITNTLAKSQNH
jgi:hypothetical protein